MSGEAQVEEFPAEYAQYGIERRTINSEEYPDICPSVFQVIQSLVESCGNGILCRPVGPVSKLMGVKSGREASFNVSQY